jgi:hypothetical protein
MVKEVNMNEYKTKKTAQAALNKEKKKLGELMCPVFKKPCITDKCAAFSGRIYEVNHYGKPKAWRMFKPCCNSPLVTGIIEMEMP